MNTIANLKCSGCKCYIVDSEINPRSNAVYKNCLKCRERKRNCPHEKQKAHCRDCNGSSFCRHNKQKHNCRDCNGTSFCKHNKFKNLCYECDGSALCIHEKQKKICRECGGNVMKKTISRFINCSKSSDKKYNRFDIVNFIDPAFCKLLIEECEDKCCYCRVELEYIHHQSNLISIERIDNSLGHIKSNVKIACFSCNLSRVGSKIDLEI